MSIIERTAGGMISGNVETNFVSVETITNQQPPANNGYFLLMNGISVGNAFYNRIGKKVTMKSIEIKMWLNPRIPQQVPGVVEPVAYEAMKMALIYDKNPSGATGAGAFPSISTLFQEYNSAGNTIDNVFAGISPLQTQRFTILLHKFFFRYNGILLLNEPWVPQDDQNFVDQTGIGFHKFYVKLRNLETLYASSTEPSTIGDISQGALYLVFWTTAGTAGSVNLSGFNIGINARLRFVG